MDEKYIDFGSFVLAAVVYGFIQIAPQLQQMVADDPIKSMIVGFAVLVISQIGSRYAIRQVKSNQAVEAPIEGGEA